MILVSFNKSIRHIAGQVELEDDLCAIFLILVLTRLASEYRHAENILTHSCYATTGQCTAV